MKHTPGPWEFGIRWDQSMWLSLGDPKVGPHYQGDLCASVADARLICAAPDLLAALRGLLDASGLDCEHDETHRGGVAWTFCDQCGASWEDDKKPVKCDAAVKAIAAIAKAEGAE